MNDNMIKKAFAEQSEWCAILGSPFTSRLMEALCDSIDRSTLSGKTILDWQGRPDALGDAVPLRLAGALHALVRRGRLPALAKLYPPNELPSPTILRDCLISSLHEVDGEICKWLGYPPQTNEVARSAILYPGLMTIAGLTRFPIELYEVGASAGLNLLMAEYEYDLGGQIVGRQGSRLRLAPSWSGPSPGKFIPVIQNCRGCDLNPLNVSNAEHRERLIAYVWPDQIDRISRLESALRIVQECVLTLDKDNAVEWIEKVLGGDPKEGTTRVLFHTVAHQYFSDNDKQRMTSQMETLGARATSRSPLAWLAFEQYHDVGPRLTLRLWPHGEEQVLAFADAHVREISWLAE